MAIKGIRALAMMAALVGAVAPAQAEPPRFPTAEAALQALVAALGSGEPGALRKVLDPADLPAIAGSDPALAREDMLRSAQAAQEAAGLRAVTPQRMTVVLGRIAWPLPIPLVDDGKGWFFDTKAGIEEIIDRRIGRNELAAIEVLRAVVRGQAEYFSVDRDGDRVHEYAQRLLSTPGTRDGLYWTTGAGETPSPLGPLIADQASYIAGKARGESYRGYYFKMLTKQGAKAPGGAHAYIINGHMIAGFAAIAWPAIYDDTGIMTFLVGPEGVVLEKDLGRDTAKTAAAIDSFDADATWQASDD